MGALPVQVPGPAVRVEPLCSVPEIVGSAVFVGAVGPGGGVVPQLVVCAVICASVEESPPPRNVRTPRL